MMSYLLSFSFFFVFFLENLNTFLTCADFFYLITHGFPICSRILQNFWIKKAFWVFLSIVNLQIVICTPYTFIFHSSFTTWPTMTRGHRMMMAAIKSKLIKTNLPSRTTLRPFLSLPFFLQFMILACCLVISCFSSSLIFTQNSFICSYEMYPDCAHYLSKIIFKKSFW